MGGASAAACVGEQQDLEQVLFDRRTGRLKNVDSLSANALTNLNVQLAIGKSLEHACREVTADLVGHLLRQRRVG
jgi:hypothetical protein